MKSFTIGLIALIMISYIIQNEGFEVPEHFKKHAKKLHKRCQNQTNTSDDVIRASFSGTLPQDDNFACYIHCIFDMIGVIDEKNVMRLESLTQVLPEELHPMITTLVESCGTKDGDDKCKIAYNTLKCYVDVNPIMLSEKLHFILD
ncbi:general odorant-binding protein 69a [Musca domestica]|uniref:General odorant-binding protein 69a n=1 Tax=Musca domestica TaxID=7370 RepID=A0A9J7HZN3_MUSDO|nr:general odorant-binding protein 69a [Musca domestica]